MRPAKVNRQAIAIGLLLTSVQLFGAILIAPARTGTAAYSRLCQWDCSDWYAKIAREGYHSVVPPVSQDAKRSNVAFFPGYPYLARTLYLVFGLKPVFALLLVAQISAVVFWAAFWRLLRRWRISTWIAGGAVLAVAAHPAALFLVAGYSESLFLAALLLFILYAPPRSATTVKASLAGFAMSATRIVGVPVASFPIVNELVQGARGRGRRFAVNRLLPPLAASVAAGCGALAFFAYCRFYFGSYDLYFQTQKIGWHVVPDYGAIFKWRDFHYFFRIDGVATVASAVGFVVLAELEVAMACFRKGGKTGFRRRLPVYFTALLLFIFTVSGLKNVNFLSMIRYSLTWYVLVILCLAHFFSRVRPLPKAAVITIGILIIFAFAMLIYRFQVPHFREYLAGRWFA